MTHDLHVVLYTPRIPYNTGNIVRLCANIGAELHLIHPLGFDLEDQRVRRAGLDYRDLVTIKEHQTFSEYVTIAPERRILGCSTSGAQIYSEIEYRSNDAILFGAEDTGLPEDIERSLTPKQLIQIPMQPSNRSLNLSNAAAIVLYEAWRQLGYVGSTVAQKLHYFS
jgi:tRNA (cytidine/uridine-2'-O-)-methyltransferase